MFEDSALLNNAALQNPDIAFAIRPPPKCFFYHHTKENEPAYIHVWGRRLNFKGKWKGIPSVSGEGEYGLDNEWGHEKKRHSIMTWAMKKNVTHFQSVISKCHPFLKYYE